MPTRALPPEIASLSIPERVALVHAIWDSIAAEEDAFELTGAQKAELDRRLAKRNESPNRGRSWPDVKERLLGDGGHES